MAFKVMTADAIGDEQQVNLLEKETLSTNKPAGSETCSVKLKLLRDSRDAADWARAGGVE